MTAADADLAELLAAVRALTRHAGRPWPEWLTLADLAAYLGGLSVDTVRLLVHERKLPQPRQVPSYGKDGRAARATKSLYRRADVDAHVGRWKAGVPAARGG
jgi:hypothetical protein